MSVTIRDITAAMDPKPVPLTACIGKTLKSIHAIHGLSFGNHPYLLVFEDGTRSWLMGRLDAADRYTDVAEKGLYGRKDGALECPALTDTEKELIALGIQRRRNQAEKHIQDRKRLELERLKKELGETE